ncbi:AMP-binding protein [Natronomonas sp. CBA1123]|uniref:class I adenylate-forming enzyme family protein n=1 Tax=Natronomonas sp. CBA1123 TaxID=2668070 RepID=UPI0012EA174A|nr:class I adenylate-forming enzyme family protein [Natronomonas sp. CBA1123]MUV87260.1 AMP-binding protein [Natronomonas sp. CBA1123]
MNLYERFARQARSNPNVSAVVDPDGEDITYAALDERAKSVAAFLDSRTEPGDRVAAYMLDNPTVVAVALGAWRAGCVFTPANYRFGAEEVAYVLDDVAPEIVVHDAVFASTAEDALEAATVEPTVLQGHAGAFRSEAFGAPEDAPDPTTRLDDDTAIVMHTSGTTGDPKGVVQTHRNVGAQVDAGISTYDVTPDDTAVVSVPLFHVGGFHGATLMGLFTGGSVVIHPAWGAAEWARLVAESEATISGLVPAMMVDALGDESAREHDTSSLRMCFYGGSPAAEATLQEFESAFGVDELLNYYGQTEAAGLTVAGTPETPRTEGALGRPVPTVETRVVDPETGEDCDEGEDGELWLRGDSVMPRYWEAPNRTDRAFDGEWFRSGDVVRREDGTLYFVDRLDDIVLSGGEKVAPSRVESVLSEMDTIDAVAVLGTPDERLGEAVTAAIVGGDELTADAVESFCDDHPGLAGYEKPRRIEFVDSFPRTGSQKIDKTELAERFG